MNSHFSAFPVHSQPFDTRAPAIATAPEPHPQHPNTAPKENGVAKDDKNTKNPIVATGDWTRDLVHLAKTAELKRHALELQTHTSRILAHHATLEQKNKLIQDIREQKNKLESERIRLMNCLREISEDRGKAEVMEATVTAECETLRSTISSITDNDYAQAKRDVDVLRAELGEAPLKNIQTILEEKNIKLLSDRRLGKRPAESDGDVKKRGRPKKKKSEQSF